VREARIARHLKSFGFLHSRGYGAMAVAMGQWSAAAELCSRPHRVLGGSHSAPVETQETFGCLCSGGFCRHKKGQLEYCEGAVDH